MTPKTAALSLKEVPQARAVLERPRAPWTKKGTVHKLGRGAWGELMPMVSPNFGGTKEEPKGEVTAPKGMDSSMNRSTWLGFC